jgi:hypothetical protein
MRTTLTGSSYTADPELRARLQAFSPDEPGVVFPFSARLAREQGWTREHARRVTGEYLRFVYLAATAGHPVTPSKMVDEAWHLHLTYTRSYWDELCARVLRRPLHHEPTRGGGGEDAKFADWYARTLESYHTAFGHQAPADIWPRPGTCACPPTRTPPQPTSRRARWRWTPVAAALAVALAAVLAGGCFGTARTSGVMAAAVSPQDVGLLAGAAVLLIFGLPAWVEKVRQNRAAQPRTRRERRYQVNGIASDGCGVDFGGGDSGDSGGGHSCGSHGGCGGHGGCGHGCGSGCGSGCGGGGCGGGE